MSASTADPASVASKPPEVARWVFWPAAVVVLVFVAFAILLPDAAESLFAGIQRTIVSNFNWYYVLIAAFFVVFCLWVGWKPPTEVF